MSKKDEALKLALEAYLCREMPAGTIIGDPKWWVPKIVMAIREALAEQPAQQELTNIERHERNFQKFLAEQPAQQEPVARQYQNRDGVWKDFISEKHYKDTLEDGSWPIRNLYKSPPAQRTWVGLTFAEICECENDYLHIFARAIEAKLKEKNT